MSQRKRDDQADQQRFEEECRKRSRQSLRQEQDDWGQSCDAKCSGLGLRKQSKSLGYDVKSHGCCSEDGGK